MNHPGEVTKLWRKEQKLSIPALAKRSGIDKGTISRFERGGDYRKRVFVAIISALGKTQQELYAMLAQLPAPASTQATAHICERHKHLLEMLDEILDDDSSPLGGWIAGNVVTFHAQWRSGHPPGIESGDIEFPHGKAQKFVRPDKPRIRVRRA